MPQPLRNVVDDYDNLQVLLLLLLMLYFSLKRLRNFRNEFAGVCRSVITVLNIYVASLMQFQNSNIARAIKVLKAD